MSNKYYKVRRKTDGLFSKGGICPKFGTNGKSWTSLVYLKNHIRQLRGNNGIPSNLNNVRPTSYDGQIIFHHVYENSEIVEYQMIEGDVSDANDMLIDMGIVPEN